MSQAVMKLDWDQDAEENKRILSLLKEWGRRLAYHESSGISQTGVIANIGSIGVVPDSNIFAPKDVYLMELPQYLNEIDLAVNKLPNEYQLFCNIWFVRRLSAKDAAKELSLSCRRRVYEKETQLVAMIRGILKT